ncbi:MAG: tripartite tricarboxylate transporter substrate binding protein [Betaproteobacteria bacterium]|nr:tripartite tricarboxylate transporter substrate binding protein [Betaproteobacteria bacterium]MSQ89360.1 tripartite tricarboxylate transporter substrate binding protein [Betaproteobacteria bacterium]
MRKVLLSLSALAFSGALFAQAYPNKPIRVIIPWPPGQATDLAARLVGEKLSQQLGQSFIMDNRPGAGGQIGTDAVVKATPDGYTLLASSSGPLSIMPNLQKTSYDALKDLAPLSLTARAPFALIAHPSFPATNAREFVAVVRANPGKYTFSSSGTGATAHLFGEMFNSAAKLSAVHVPYQGSAPAMTALIGGQIHYSVETVLSVVGHIKNGRLKVFGVTTATRTAALPEVPTLAEAADLPGFEAAAWIGYSAPAGTPREIVMRLATEIQKVMQTPDIKERYVTLGLNPVSSTPDEFAAFMRGEQSRYATIIKDAGIKIQQ